MQQKVTFNAAVNIVIIIKRCNNKIRPTYHLLRKSNQAMTRNLLPESLASIACLFGCKEPNENDMLKTNSNLRLRGMAATLFWLIATKRYSWATPFDIFMTPLRNIKHWDDLYTINTAFHQYWTKRSSTSLTNKPWTQMYPEFQSFDVSSDQHRTRLLNIVQYWSWIILIILPF